VLKKSSHAAPAKPKKKKKMRTKSECSHHLKRERIKMNPAYIPESRFLFPYRTWLETGNATKPATTTQRAIAWVKPFWLWIADCRSISNLPSTYFSTTSYSVYPSVMSKLFYSENLKACGQSAF
jgi:hypothetical protein